MPTVLALETSCDESAAAIVRDRTLLASALASQVEEHARWGGVVPEIASRRHVEALPQLIAQVCLESDLALADLDGIAATVAPGLVGALLVASVTGRTLARLYAKPFVAVHHLEGHLCSVQLGEPLPPGPYLVLLVSGGHTELLRVDGPGRYLRLGRSHDDAAGEAFDKVARLLGLAYPGGPAIEVAGRHGDPSRFALPKGRVSRPEGATTPTTSVSVASRRPCCARCGPWSRPDPPSPCPWPIWRPASSRWWRRFWWSGVAAAPGPGT